ncbi:sulfotransferase family protein [Rubinisphaera margarita]|uniref:sulfotransferase family protein n=1 Tax=Rubinisphaera margarita TaxID=2909586 RepID=UPI001EE7EAFE|nr:sulfotransferase [Rubinisphaera margarita]MCG6154873.1 sulfotransferase [Rubinisphaera margarita]
MSKPNGKSAAKPVRNSQRGLVIWHGMRMREFAKLVNVGAELHWSQLHRILPTLFMTAHNSIWYQVEQLRMKRKLEQTEVQPPIFVLGHWRSGTTFLHNLMTLDDRFTYPNLYQCIFPHHFLTTEKAMAGLTSFMVPKKRPMDNMQTGWKLPQEDEIALLLMTTYSPYRNLAFQGYRERYEKYFDFKEAPQEERDEWKRALMTLVKKLTIRNNKPVVLKSPGHTYRIEILRELFPDAKFVYIYRHPYDVIRSTIHLRGVMFQSNALGRLNLQSNEELIFEAYEQCIKTYEQDKKQIPEGHLYEVKYEELEKDPVGHMRAVYEGLDFPDFNVVQPKIEQYVAGQKEYKKNVFATDPHLAEVVNNRMKFVLDAYGYDPVA